MRQQQTQPKEYDCARLSQVRSLLAGYPAAALCYQITLVTNYSMEPAPKGLYARGGTANSVLNRYSLDRPQLVLIDPDAQP